MVPLDGRHADLFALRVLLAELVPLQPLEERSLARRAVAPAIKMVSSSGFSIDSLNRGPRLNKWVIRVPENNPKLKRPIFTPTYSL